MVKYFPDPPHPPATPSHPNNTVFFSEEVQENIHCFNIHHYTFTEHTVTHRKNNWTTKTEKDS
jgi:hypothetical protein